MNEERTDISCLDIGNMSPNRPISDTSRNMNLSTSEIEFGTDWTVGRMKNEITTLRAKLSNAESMIEIRKGMGDLAKQELDILERRSRIDSETMQRQQQDLEVAMLALQEARKAQVTAETDLAQLKESTDEIIKDLMLENASLSTNTLDSNDGSARTSFQWQHNSLRMENLAKVSESVAIKLEVDLEENSIIQNDFDQPKIELDDTSVKIKQLTTKLMNREHDLSLSMTRITYLEEQLQTIKKLISINRQSNELPEKNEKQDEAHSEVKQINFSDESKVGVTTRASARSNRRKAFMRMKTPVLSVKLEKLQIRCDKPIGRKSNYCPTHPKFFHLDWDQECKKIGDEIQRWKCLKCHYTYVNRMEMQDHIWVDHYKEKFQCARCNYRFAWRSMITLHLRKAHPEFLSRGMRQMNKNSCRRFKK